MSVRIEGLRRSFGDHAVLRGVDLEATPSTVLALLGHNGAGKTTLIRVVATLLAPHGGTVTVDGHDVDRAPARVRAALSLTGQFAAVDDELTGRENLELSGRLAHLGRRGARVRTGELLERFDLTGAADRRLRGYSGGMRRRLDLAMSLVGRPSVLVLDEPTTGLDPTSRETLWAAVRELAAEGATVLLTTQYLPEADRLADRVAVLCDGRIVADGRPEELKARVGGTRLDLEFTDPVRRERAAAALGLPVPAGPGTPLPVPSDGTGADLHRLLASLETVAAVPDRLTTHRPDLDDVFRVLAVSEPVAAVAS